MHEDLVDLRQRAERGDPLSQAEVARLLGLRRQTVHAIERRALGKLRTALGGADASGTAESMPIDPKQPVRHPPRPKDKRYRQQYGVIVLCKDEAEQKAVFDRLREQGLRIRVVVT